MTMKGPLFAIALRNVLRHWQRTLITALVMSVGIATYIFYDSALAGMDRMTIDAMTEYSVSSISVRTEAYEKNSGGTPLDFGITDLEAITALVAKTVPKAVGITPRTKFIGSASNLTDELPIMGTIVDPIKDTGVFKVSSRLSAGTWFGTGSGKSTAADSSSEVPIGKGLAHDLGLKLGDWFVLSGRTLDDSINADQFQVGGIIDVPDPQISKSGVFLSYAQAERLLGVKLPVTEIDVAMPRAPTLDSELSKAAEASKNIERALNVGARGMVAIPIGKAAGDYLAMRNMKSKYSMIIILMVLAISAVGIVNTILMSMYSRIKEIGILKAYGMERRSIRRLFSLEGVLIGFAGSVGGIVIGAVAVWFSVNMGISLDGILGNIDFGNIPLAGTLYGEWHFSAFLIGFIFGILSSWLSSMIPAARASKLEATDALRFV
jgi:putative ABC transport system permease protein